MDATPTMTSGAPPYPPPSASGALARTPFPHLLIYVMERQLTGTIELTAPDGQRATVLVLEGFPSKVRTYEPASSLGQVFVAAGLITPEQLDASMAYYRPGAKLHGQVLLEMGVLDPQRLLEGLRLQVVRKLEQISQWPPETTFAYFDGFDALAAHGGDDIVTVDPLPLVWGAIKQAPSWEHVHAALSRIGSAPLRLAQSADLDRLALTSDERAFVEVIRTQPRRLYEMTSSGTIGPSAKQLLVYCLLITKQIDVLPEDAARRVTMRPVVAPPVAPAPPPTAPTSVARVQLAARSMSKPPVAVEEARTVEAMRRDQRVSAPGITPPPTAKIDSAIAEATRALENVAPLPPPVIRSPEYSSGSPAAPLAPPAAPLSDELSEQRKKILRRAEEITRQNYFEMLGVTRDAPAEEIQKAYFLLAKVWHPDRLPPAIADVRDQCTRVFAHLNEAHQTLTDPKRRGHYMTLMKDGGATPDEQQQVASVLEAATNFQKAEICLRRNDIAQAEHYVRLAHAADPNQADYLALLAWLEAMKPENQSADPTMARIAMLDRAIRLNDKCERAYFYRGMLYKRVGNEKGAYKDFKDASDLNPRNIDAQREVRLYQMRKGRPSVPPEGPSNPGGRVAKKPSSDQPGGIFGRLFKK